MEVIEKGKSSFTYLEVYLEPNEEIVSESGAMASMDNDIDIETSFKGGFLSAILRKLFGGESIFFNTYKNKGAQRQCLVLSKATPGDMVCQELNGNTLFLQPGAFVCCSSGVRIHLKWAGFRFLFGGEGLFRLAATGRGKLWVGVFGALVEQELHGELIVDSGHLVAYPPGVKYNIQLSGGVFSSFFSKEGLVGRLQGNGKVLLQTRSMGGLVSWLNPRLPN